MAIGMKMKVPDGTAEFYDAVMRELDWDNSDYPEGFISHYAGPVEGGWLVFDVWESEGHFSRFVEERLGPALAKASGGEPPQVQPTFIPIYNQEHAAARVGA